MILPNFIHLHINLRQHRMRHHYSFPKYYTDHFHESIQTNNHRPFSLSSSKAERFLFFSTLRQNKSLELLQHLNLYTLEQDYTNENKLSSNVWIIVYQVPDVNKLEISESRPLPARSIFVLNMISDNDSDNRWLSTKSYYSIEEIAAIYFLYEIRDWKSYYPSFRKTNHTLLLVFLDQRAPVLP